MQEKEILSDHCKNLTTEYDPHFGQEVFAEESGVHIPIEIYEGCEYMFLFCCLSHFCKFGRHLLWVLNQEGLVLGAKLSMIMLYIIDIGK